MRLGPGTLYGALSRLWRQGLVEPLASEERRKPRTASRRPLALWAQVPVLFTGDDGILATPTSANWMAILVVMGGCACAAVRGLGTVRESESL